jgi:membrane protease YdiL (CAAX protease family)
MNKKLKKILLFLGLTFLINWGMVGVFTLLGGQYSNTSIYVLGSIYMLIPMIVAVIVQKGIYKEPVKEPLGISFKLNRWFIMAWIITPIIAFATFGVSLLLPGIEYSEDMAGMFERFAKLLSPEQVELMKRQAAEAPIPPIFMNLLSGLIAGPTINAVFAFGEELGWRGFLQRELNFMGFWKSSFLIGLIWGLWHAPLILKGHNFPQHPVEGVFMMVIAGILLSPIFGYIRIKAKSVIAAAVIHGTLNATYGLSIIMIKGGNDLTTGVFGLPGLIVLLIVNLLFFIYDVYIAKKNVMKESFYAYNE